VGENWEIVSSYLQAWGGVILGLMLLFALVQMLRYALSRKPTQESTE